MQTDVKESLYLQLGKMMGKRAIKQLKKSSPSRNELRELKENAERFLIGRIVSAE
jgi:hypothetical protein